MELYVRLWPVWLLVAALMVNLFVSTIRAVQADLIDDEKSQGDSVAMVTVVVLTVASVVNVVACMAVTLLLKLRGALVGEYGILQISEV